MEEQNIAVIRGKRVKVQQSDKDAKGQWLLSTIDDVGIPVRKNDIVYWNDKQWKLKGAMVSRFNNECAILIKE